MLPFSRKKNPAVTVILRCGDVPHRLRRSIRALADQSLTDWQAVIVLDGAGRAMVEKELAAFPAHFGSKFLVLREPDRLGFARGAQVNLGLRNSRSDFVCVLDAGHVVRPAFLERMVARICITGGVAAACRGHLVVADEEGERELSRFEVNPWWCGRPSLARLAESPIFMGHGFLFRRRLVEEVGEFERELRLVDIWEFALRVASRYPIEFEPEFLAESWGSNSRRAEKEWNGWSSTTPFEFNLIQEVRDLHLRKDLAAGRSGLGAILTASHNHGQLFQKLHAAELVMNGIVAGAFTLEHPVAEARPATAAASSGPLCVAYACDEQYALPLTVSLRSLIDNYRGTRAVRIFLLTAGVAPEARARILDSLPTRPDFTFEWIELGDTARDLKQNGHFSPSNYYRLFLAELLPAEVDRLLYIDSDTLVLDDISPLGELDLREYPLWAVRDHVGSFGSPQVSIPDPAEFNAQAEDPYFNSGVLLFRLELWRRERLGPKCLSLGRRRPELCTLADQNLLNIVLHGRIGELATGWNYQLPVSEMRHGKLTDSGGTMPAVMPRILHFTSARKPWLLSFDLPLQKLYADHVARTKWPMPEPLRAFAGPPA